LLGTTLVSIYLLAITFNQTSATASRALWWLGAVVTALIAALSGWLFINPEVALNPSGLRILWQLIQGTGASLILWFGCWLLFAKRAGVVLLHAGIGLMLYSEVHTAVNSVETHIRMVEGETASYAEDLRYFELAFIDKSAKATDHEVVVPIEILRQAYEKAKSAEDTSDAILSDEALPFDVKIKELYPNAELRELQPGQVSPANLGVGQAYRFVEKDTSTGVDMNQAFDSPGAVIELLDKESGDSAGVLSLYPTLPGAVVEAKKNAYEVRIRPKPYDKPYTLTLLDFERKTYVGSDKTKSFKSIVQLKDPELGVDRRVEIWMNNPLRYRGDTIYQSSFDPGNLAYTDLQAVKNSG
ncbi:MAG: cytochrome c biogenesis protein ResB, partial [Lacipirellulaceae bacterium]